MNDLPVLVLASASSTCLCSPGLHHCNELHRVASCCRQTGTLLATDCGLITHSCEGHVGSDFNNTLHSIMSSSDHALHVDVTWWRRRHRRPKLCSLHDFGKATCRIEMHNPGRHVTTGEKTLETSGRGVCPVPRSFDVSPHP